MEEFGDYSLHGVKLTSWTDYLEAKKYLKDFRKTCTCRDCEWVRSHGLVKEALEQSRGIRGLSAKVYGPPHTPSTVTSESTEEDDEDSLMDMIKERVDAVNAEGGVSLRGKKKSIPGSIVCIAKESVSKSESSPF